ncbi:hypothetical protein HK104_006345 [Borealophlyctis nickersoniae]|nr:hypothetical protein HK104_006345 [Borealophlyctis nickersoniae]
MFEGIIAPVIKKFLGDYVANLESTQLSVGIWQGDVVLHNLKLKREALDKFNLPIDVLEGYLGELTLNIPWNDLKNKPVKVYINNVYLLAAPKGDTDYDPEEEEDRAQKLKQEKLETAEMLSARGKQPNLGNEKHDSSFITSLVTKIVDNLQITMKNIHIRYEDKISNLNAPFAVGLTLQEFSAVSTDNEWHPRFIQSETGIVFKLLRLESLALYWNTQTLSLAGKTTEESLKIFTELIASDNNVPPEHQYILRPVTGTGKVKSYKTYQQGQPRTSANFQFDELGFVLDDEQYSSLFALVESFSFQMRAHKYRKFRPPRTITPMLDPMAWFKYAGTSILSDIHERNRKWTWDFFARRRDDRNQYVASYKDLQRGTISPEEHEVLKELERKLSYEDIRFYRSIAKSQLRKEQALLAKTRTIKKDQPARTGWSGWTTWLTGGGQHEEQTEDQATLSEEEVKQLYDTIEFDPQAALESQWPSDAVLLDAQCELNTGSLTLKRSPHGDMQTLMSIVFEEFSGSVKQHPASLKGLLSLGGMRMDDGTTPGTLYPTLIRAKNKKDDSASVSEMNTAFFRMEVEQNPLDERADNAVTIRMLPLEVIYNPIAISSLLEFFARQSMDSATYSTIQAVAQDTFQGLTAQTRAGLEYALEEHKTLDLKVDMDAPIFIFPESVTDPAAMVAVVDAGHLLVESNLVDKERKKELQQKHGSHLTEKDLAYLKSLLYDRFTCELSSVQVLLGSSLKLCLDEVANESTTGDLHMIERVSMEFCIELCILPKLAEFPRMKISGELPRLHLNLSDRKYKTTMRILDLVLASINRPETQAPAPAFHHDSVPYDWNFLSGQEKSELVLSSESDDENDSFFDASENLSRAGTESEAGVDPPDRVMMEFYFVVSQASVSLKKSDRDPRVAEKVLADLTIARFSLNVQNRPFDMDVNVAIQAVEIEDRMQEVDPVFKYLLSPSDKAALESGVLGAAAEGGDPLVHVHYRSVKPESPEYLDIDQDVEVSLAAVTVVLASGPVLTLYDFILTTFTGEGTKSRASSQSSLQSVLSPGGTEHVEVVEVSPQQPSTMQVRASMKSISFLVVKDDQPLATARFGALQTRVLMKQNTMCIDGRIGDLSVVDEVARIDEQRAYRQLLKIEGQEVAHFTWETFNPNEPGYPGYDSALSLRGNSMRLTYLERLINELTAYLSEFAKMHLLLEKARQAAVESAAQIQESAGKFHFDLEIQTPILEFPHVSLKSKDMLIVYPGSISARNAYLNKADGSVINEITADLQSMKLVSNFFRGESMEESQIIDDVNIHVVYESIQSEPHGPHALLPESSVAITVSDVRMNLTMKQYAFLLQLSNSFTSSSSTPSSAQSGAEGRVIEQAKAKAITDSPHVANDTRVNMDIHLVIPTICLEIFVSEDQSMQNTASEETSLGRFSINSVTTKAAMLKNGSMEAELQVKNFSVQDTRAASGNLFRDIMPSAGREEDQLVMHISRTDKGSNLLVVTLDSPKIVLVLDHIFQLRDFFLIPMTSQSQSQQVADAGDKQTMAEPDESGESLSYRINLVDVEIILLQNAKVASTEAIILSSKQLVVAQEVVTSVSVQEMSMFFCAMDKRGETTLRFIQDFNFTMSMDNRMTAPGHHLTGIVIDMSSLMLRVSYRDILLIMEILNQISELSSKSAQPVSVPGIEEASSALVKSKGPEIIMARERLQASIQGIRMILIDDLNDLHLPMFDLVVDKLVVDVADWSSHLRVEIGPSIYVNYFNVKNSHWEPLIEPWQFFLNVSKQADNGAMAVDFYSRKKLEINVTHVLVETLLQTADIWSKQEQRNLTARRGVHAPYIFRNRTGYDMTIWADSVGDGLDTELKQLPEGQDMPWRFDDWRTMRERTSPIPNKVSLQLHGPPWETLKGVSVDREGAKPYVLRPALNRVVHRLVCDVKLKNNVKIVTFRSATVIKNETSMTVHAMTVNSKRQMTCGVYEIPAGGERPIPIEAAYYDYVQIRPQEGFGYNWCNELLSWRDLQKQAVSLITSNSFDPSIPPFRFQLNAVFDKEARNLGYPMLTMRLLPPFQLENLLPYDFKYLVYDKITRQEHRDLLKQGATDPVHTLDPMHLLALSIEVLGTEYRPSDVAIISNSDLDYRDENLVLRDSDGRELNLRLKYSDKLDSGGRKVSVYSPYVLLNKTGLDVWVSARSLLATSRFAGVTRAKNKDQVEPFMFSYSNFEPLRSRAQIKVSNSDWSKPLSFEAVGSSYEVALPSATRGLETRVGVTIREGEGKFYLTKVVTFAPRFILKNKMDEDLQLRQHGTTAAILLKSKDSLPLHGVHVLDGSMVQLCCRLTGLTNEWSNPINITEVGRIFVKLGRMGSPEEDLIRAEVILEDATIFVVFVGREKRWPFLIRNQADVDVVVWQHGAKNRYKIPAKEARPYAWDNPSSRHKFLTISVNGREREIDVLEIGQLVPFKYPIPGTNKSGIMAIHVFAQGPTIVIDLRPYHESESNFRRALPPRESSLTSLQQVDGKDTTFEMKRKSTQLLFAYQIRMEGIGISVINPQGQELVYASAKNVLFACTDTTTDRAMTFSIKWLQIDNQLYEALEPIFVYPTVIPKEGDEEYHPVLMATLSKSKDTSYGVEYYEWFTILLQELSIDMDENFLYALIEFTKFDVPGWNDAQDKLCDTSMAIPEPQLMEDDTRMYFEKFLLQPVQFNISFVRTETAARDDRHRHRGVLAFVVDVLTMTLGNIHDAPIRLNALELRHPIMTWTQLSDLIVKFYSQEIVSQLHKVIGSADVLGNPVGLFNNVSSGVSDFFYEPLQGFEITRPQDFGIGVAKGTASLFKKTVFGVSDTFSKFTESIGKGLSVITLDEQFQERRRLTRARNRPRHAVYGITAGATSFAQSVASGVTGVVSKPIEGAQQEGVGGFFKGLGKGIVGVVTKPVIGVFDLASNVGEGIRNTTTVFDVDLDRQRLPRHVGKDKILTPYSHREALGLSWLKGLENGRYFHEEYIAHIELRIEDLVAMVTDVRVMMIRIKKLKVDWDITFEELQLVRTENGGITLIKKHSQNANARIIPCPDQASAQWFGSKVEQAFAAYIEQHRPYE